MEYTTNDGTHLTLKLCDNSELFTELSTMEIVKPTVPSFYLEQRDIHIQNPDHPAYREAMQIYEVEKVMYATKAMLKLAIVVDEDILQKEKSGVKYRLLKPPDTEVWIAYLMRILTEVDMANIVNQCFLTENIVYGIFDVLASTIYRGSSEITEARLKNAINSEISVSGTNVYGAQLVHPLDEYTACVESNIPWTDWRELEINRRAEAIALYRIRTIVRNHGEDEAAIESERQSKK